MKDRLEKPTKEEQKMAQSSVVKLSEISQNSTRSNSRTVNIKLNENGDFIKIPKKAFSMLITVLNTMADGKSIALLPNDTELSTQQAAGLLNVSRPHLVALLENGNIPFQKAGTHRRIQVKDVLAYRNKMKEKQKKGLSFLAKQAQDLNMGYS